MELNSNLCSKLMELYDNKLSSNTASNVAVAQEREKCKFSCEQALSSNALVFKKTSTKVVALSVYKISCRYLTLEKMLTFCVSKK